MKTKHNKTKIVLFKLVVFLLIYSFSLVNVSWAVGSSDFEVNKAQVSYLSPNTSISQAELKMIFSYFIRMKHLNITDLLAPKPIDVSKGLVAEPLEDLEIAMEIDRLIAATITASKARDRTLPVFSDWEEFFLILKESARPILRRYLYLQKQKDELTKQSKVVETAILDQISKSSFGTATSFFRDGHEEKVAFRKGWVKKLEEYFAVLIPEKVAKGDYRLNIKSIGGANGSEAYSVAIILYDQLVEFAQKNNLSMAWVERWDIQIENYDFSFYHLLQNKLGRYEISLTQLQYIEKHFIRYRKYFNFKTKKNTAIAEFPSVLKSWMRPVYVNFSYNNFKTPEEVAAYFSKQEKANVIFSVNFFYWIRGLVSEVERGITLSLDTNFTSARVQNDGINLAAFVTVYDAQKEAASTDDLMRFYLENGKVTGNEDHIFPGISLKTAYRKINKIMENIPDEFTIKEINITKGGSLGYVWQDRYDGKIVLFMNRILFDSRKNWERKMHMILDHEWLHLKGDMNWKNKRKRLIEEAVVIAHELMLRLKEGKINEVDEDLKDLEKMAHNRADNELRESISRLIQLNRILSKEGRLTSKVLDYLINDVLEIDKGDGPFRTMVEHKIEARLGIRVDLPIEVQINRIKSLTGARIQPQLHSLQNVIYSQAQVSQAI